MGPSVVVMLGGFKPFHDPRTPFGAHYGPKPMTWSYLGLRGSNHNSEGTFLGCNATFDGFNPLASI